MIKELNELENFIFEQWKQNHVNFGCDYKLETELEKQLSNLVLVKQELLEKQELLKKYFKDEYTFNKIMQIMVDGVFYDDRGERYATPTLYYDNGLCIIDADTGGCGVGIENYGKAFAREVEEIER